MMLYQKVWHLFFSLREIFFIISEEEINLRKKIKQIIVVEGKNDYNAVSRSVDAHIIISSGFGLNSEILKEIKTAQEKNGVIVLTDPDFMGEKIRTIIEKKIPGVIHAYISRKDGTADNDVGVENASPEVILLAIEKALLREGEYSEARIDKSENEESMKESADFIKYTSADLYNLGLTGGPGSEERRASVAERLGLGSCNAKQFLIRLNRYRISRSEFMDAVEATVDIGERNE